MTRRKRVCSNWTLVLVLVVLCPSVYSRPQEASVSASPDSSTNDVSTENNLRTSSGQSQELEKPQPSSTDANLSREVKTKTPIIGESMQAVASQLLQTPNNGTVKNVLSDTRIPPKIKNKIKTRHDDPDVTEENSHVGEAVPVSMEELESENKLGNDKPESSTSSEGISTWILLSNTGTNTSTPTEPTKAEEPLKKKNSSSKNKNKKPQSNKPSKRPIIGSTNKSDLVAGGSAINENVLNKLKDTVLTNVQKNKSTQTQRTTTTTTTTTTEPSTEAITTKISSTEIPVTKSTKLKKKNKNKIKTTSTVAPVNNDSALLPMEAKEQEIELEVSTPPPTITKKPKRPSSKKKKNKTKKHSKPKPEETSVSVNDIKTSNKTKSVKPVKSKKPATNNSSAISTQIYNYLSREVMPSVGVGMLGLASLVGIASYFFYPFSTPVRRTLDVDKKDDLYIHNAEEYANDGNGQAEEEMLGTVLAGMPAHAKQKLNPYAGQTAHINRYPAKKEQDLRYRHGAATSYTPNYNVRYPQQKTGIAHGVVYPEKVNYNPYTYETRHAQTTEGKYAYDKSSSVTYAQPSVHPAAVEPIYAVPQTGPSGSSYVNDGSSSVVYGVSPSDSDFKPVYSYEHNIYSETTSNPATYAPTSMYLGSNKDEEILNNQDVEDTSGSEQIDNKFVVGNVPKELSNTATPAVVPEHGPRLFARKRRSVMKQEKGLYVDDLLAPLSKQSTKYVIMSNEIEDVPLSKSQIKELKASMDHEELLQTTTEKNKIIESVSTAPIINNNSQKITTENTVDKNITTNYSSSLDLHVIPYANQLAETNTAVTAETTESITETPSEPKVPSNFSESTELPVTSTKKPKYTTKYPDLFTYPPSNQSSGVFSALRKLIEFKYKLGLSILQSTSDSLNRYLHEFDTSPISSKKRSLPKKIS